MRTLVFVIAALLALPARAERAVEAPPKIKDTYGFDWIRPNKSKCVKITGALLAKLEKSYTCVLPDAGSASGKPIVAVCTAKSKRRSEYMLMSTAEDCKLERETQLANGP